MNGVVIADSNALYRLFDASTSGHDAHRTALSRMEHVVVSPLVLTELEYLLTRRASPRVARASLGFVARQAQLRKVAVPDVAPHLGTALAVAEGYADADGGKGVGLVDAMNVALAAAYETDAMFTSDKRFRMMRPLTGHHAFRLLPEDEDDA